AGPLTSSLLEVVASGHGQPLDRPIRTVPHARRHRHRRVAGPGPRAGAPPGRRGLGRGRRRAPRLRAGGGRRGPRSARARGARRRDGRGPQGAPGGGGERPGRPRPAREQRLHAGPGAAPGAGALPAAGAARGLRDERGRAARPRPAVPAAPRGGGRRGRERDPRRRRRGLSGLGRLRRRQGGPRAAQPRAGGRAPARARVLGRPRRHEHAYAAGGVPRRGRLGQAAAQRQRARHTPSCRGAAALGALPRQGRGGGGVTLPAVPAEPRGAPGYATRAGYRPRGAVRLMVADAATGAIAHRRFDALAAVMSPGDVLVINVSATVPAALEGASAEGPVRVHLSSPVAGSLWTAEPRRPAGVGSLPWRDFGGGRVELPGGAAATFVTRDARSPRLWLVALEGVGDVLGYLQRPGQP